MNQYNITVTPTVKTILKVRSKEDFGKENGWLKTVIPANDPTPDFGKCHVDPNDLIIFLGGGAVASCKTVHCSVLFDTKTDAANQDILSFDRKGKSMTIHLLLFDKEKKIIAVVDDNRTHANTRVAFDWQRPDPHTIDVTDEYNKSVLHLRFLNPYAIYIEGAFKSSSGDSFEATSNSFRVNRMTLSGKTCVGNSPYGVVF